MNTRPISIFYQNQENIIPFRISVSNPDARCHNRFCVFGDVVKTFFEIVSLFAFLKTECSTIGTTVSIVYNIDQANFLFGPLINLDRPIVDFLVLSILCCIT